MEDALNGVAKVFQAIQEPGAERRVILAIVNSPGLALSLLELAETIAKVTAEPKRRGRRPRVQAPVSPPAVGAPMPRKRGRPPKARVSDCEQKAAPAAAAAST